MRSCDSAARAKPVGAKWVFSYNTDKDGIIGKTNAGLVATDFSQSQRRLFPNLCTNPIVSDNKNSGGPCNEQGLKIFHLDVAQAFVRAKLYAEIYMELPDGFGDMSGKIFVCLERSLYGLKQSGRRWARLLVENAVEFGLEQCRTDPCVFRMVVNDKVELSMAIRVDDIASAGSDEACRGFHAALNTKFPTNNLGELTWYTCCAFKRNGELGTLEITQKALVESMPNRFGANSCSDIPATPGVELGPREEGEPKGDWPYREAVGSLMYCRP